MVFWLGFVVSGVRWGVEGFLCWHGFGVEGVGALALGLVFRVLGMGLVLGFWCRAWRLGFWVGFVFRG